MLLCAFKWTSLLARQPIYSVQVNFLSYEVQLHGTDDSQPLIGESTGERKYYFITEYFIFQVPRLVGRPETSRNSLPAPWTWARPPWATARRVWARWVPWAPPTWARPLPSWAARHTDPPHHTSTRPETWSTGIGKIGKGIEILGTGILGKGIGIENARGRGTEIRKEM